jgi:hypothetical protein
MARLIDDIFVNPILGDDRSDLESERLALESTTVIVIDNVAKYMYQDYEGYDMNSFPNVAPPFNDFFMEYRGSLLSLVDGMPEQRIRNVGIHFGACSYDDICSIRYQRPDVSIVRMLNEMEEENKEFHWLLAANVFIQTDKIMRLPCQYITPVSKDGAIISGFRVAIYGSESYRTDIPDGSFSAVGRLMMYPGLLALSFMHCKNVELVKQAPPAPLSKKFQKRHGRPLVRYHVLDIEPMKKVLRSEGESEKTGIKKALHICRGHFKDYRQRGLFGKIKGLYWWDSHVRGTIEQGIVDKDYRVKEPKQ